MTTSKTLSKETTLQSMPARAQLRSNATYMIQEQANQSDDHHHHQTKNTDLYDVDSDDEEELMGTLVYKSSRTYEKWLRAKEKEDEMKCNTDDSLASPKKKYR